MEDLLEVITKHGNAVELLHLDDAIAVIAQRPRNGAEVPTVLAHCAMHAVFTTPN
jgi:hypothetical protein